MQVNQTQENQYKQILCQNCLKLFEGKVGSEVDMRGLCHNCCVLKDQSMKLGQNNA